MVVPRLHVRVLEELSLSCRAGVLAAVQRAANAVRVENPWSGVRVVIVADPPTSEGHMAIHVQPGGPGGSRASARGPREQSPIVYAQRMDNNVPQAPPWDNGETINLKFPRGVQRCDGRRDLTERIRRCRSQRVSLVQTTFGWRQVPFHTSSHTD